MNETNLSQILIPIEAVHRVLESGEDTSFDVQSPC